MVVILVARPLSCINRNIVECKDLFLCTFDCFFSVLIETLWNVKKEQLKTGRVARGINRNIVECKVQLVPEYAVILYMY